MIRRTTETKMVASPAPTRKRAAKAPGTDSVTASSPWPRAITSRPTVSTRRGPIRSRISPTGICIAPYTPSCSTAKVERVAAVTPKRSEVSAATAESDERLTMARM